ncbi:MAG: Hpt domain-containing protein [Rubrivivax sp.]|nr:Hpt domain-containing protein [Rubrivivax sp.]
MSQLASRPSASTCARRETAALPTAVGAAAPDAASAMRSSLHAGGILERRALLSVGGSASAYRRILVLFCSRHGEDATALARLMHDGDRAAAARVLHKLRGGAVTIGAVLVARRARQLESALGLRGAPTGDRAAQRACHEALHGALQRAVRATAGLSAQPGAQG